jgi:hypothetical protein
MLHVQLRLQIRKQKQKKESKQTQIDPGLFFSVQTFYFCLLRFVAIQKHKIFFLNSLSVYFVLCLLLNVCGFFL